MNTRPLIRLFSLAVLPLVLSCSAGAADPVAKVNGTAIPQSRLDAMLKGATAQGQPESPELRNRVRDELITREILMQEAAKKGTDKTADVLNQIEIQRQSLIIQAFLNDYVRSNPVSNGARGSANGLTTVTPRQVKPLWKSSESSSRQWFSAATAKIKASHIGSW